MPQINNFPGGFAAGLTIRGLPVAVTHPGKIFWVGNATASVSDRQIGASNGNKGTFDAPWATLAYAMTQVVANRGDVIMVKPGHAETYATAGSLVCDIAGVAVIGLGTGTKRPTLTFSATTSTILIKASNVSFQNFLFLGTAATTFTASAFVNTNAIVANDVTIDNCEFRDSSATTGFIACYTVGTTANQGDGLAFTNNLVRRKLTSPPAANTAVVVGSAIDRMNFSDNYIVNTTANNNIALGFALGANAATMLMVARNRTQSLNTGTTAGELFSGSSTACSGLVFDNYSWHLAATGLLAPVSTKLGFVENYCSITGAADKSALLNPVAV